MKNRWDIRKRQELPMKKRNSEKWGRVFFIVHKARGL